MFRLDHEHDILKNQIEELKLALEQAQIDRRRKVEYDAIAEKINTLPSRAELEQFVVVHDTPTLRVSYVSISSIAEIESDMQVIRVEHESQNRTIYARKTALDAIVSDLGQLRILGKETAAAVAQGDANGSRAPSEPTTPVHPANAADTTMQEDGEEGSESPSTGKSRDGDSQGHSTLTVPHLNPSAKSFAPRRSTPLLHTATQQLRLQNSVSMESSLGADMGGIAGSSAESREVTPAPPPLTPTQTQEDNVDLPTTSREASPGREDGEEKEDDDKREEREEGEEHEDIEMGEVSESNGRSRKSLMEDREEGEASDLSSELSELPEEE